MPIYKYTLFKYIKSPSTWIILFISAVVIAFGIGTALPFGILKLSSSTITTDYITTVVSVTAGVTSFLAVFTSVFAGFKAATMYKDEVEDGTFLVILSKPMRRSQIILMKWIALQTLIAGYTLITVMFFVIGISIFDIGSKVPLLANFNVSTLKSNIIVIGLFIWMILFVMGLIFSSISLLLSTKLSVGATIGISIAIGVFIPITSLIGIFLKKEEYKNFDNTTYRLLSQQMRAENIYNIPTAQGYKEALVKNLDRFDKLTQSSNSVVQNIAGRTGDTDGYKKGWIVDLNFQIQTLSSFAYERVVPSGATALVTTLRGTNNAPGLNGTRWNASGNKTAQAQEFFNQTQDMLVEFEPIRESIAMASLTSTLSKITLSDIVMTRSEAAQLSYIFTEFSPSTTNFSKIPTLLLPLRNELKIAETTTQAEVKISSINLKALFAHFYTFDSQSIIDWKEGDLPLFHKPGRKNFKDLLYLDNISYSNSNLGDKWLDARLYAAREQILSIFKKNILDFKIAEKDYFESFNTIVNNLDNPLNNFFLNFRRVDEFAKSWNVTVLPKIDEYEKAYTDTTTADNPKVLQSLSPSDENLLKTMISIANKDLIYQVKAEPYASKYLILFLYIGIAVVLVPIAYLVVRRQDFR